MKKPLNRVSISGKDMRLNYLVNEEAIKQKKAEEERKDEEEDWGQKNRANYNSIWDAYDDLPVFRFRKPKQ